MTSCISLILKIRRAIMTKINGMITYVRTNSKNPSMFEIYKVPLVILIPLVDFKCERGVKWSCSICTCNYWSLYPQVKSGINEMICMNEAKATVHHYDTTSDTPSQHYYRVIPIGNSFLTWHIVKDATRNYATLENLRFLHL